MQDSDLYEGHVPRRGDGLKYGAMNANIGGFGVTSPLIPLQRGTLYPDLRREPGQWDTTSKMSQDKIAEGEELRECFQII